MIRAVLWLLVVLLALAGTWTILVLLFGSAADVALWVIFACACFAFALIGGGR